MRETPVIYKITRKQSSKSALLDGKSVFDRPELDFGQCLPAPVVKKLVPLYALSVPNLPTLTFRFNLICFQIGVLTNTGCRYVPSRQIQQMPNCPPLLKFKS